MSYKIKEVADIVGVSVRTLHHYDQIGLLKVENMTESGYRIYDDKDLERLQQILFFKELDFSLKEIKSILDNPNFDRKHALESQRELLIEKKKRMERIISSIEKTIDSIKGDEKMSKKDMFNAFSMNEIEAHKKKYEKEVKERYGNTDAYKESEKRTAKYGKAEWNDISTEAQQIYNGLANLMDRDINDKEVQELVEAWRNHISKNFYECNLEIFRGLAEMYVADERFTQNIDKTKKGLAEFLSSAMIAYCDNLEK